MKKLTKEAQKVLKVYVILCDIRSAHNVGSVFRTADSAGVSEIFLCGYTPAPKDRFGRVDGGPQKDIAKVALGAEKTVSWQSVESAEKLIHDLKKAYVVAIEQAPEAVSIKKIAVKIKAKIAAEAKNSTEKKIVFVFGNETDGLPKNILKICDDVAYIPMVGKKESLNVSVAVGVALYLALDIN